MHGRGRVDNDDVCDFLQAVAALVVHISYSGLIVIVDEAASIRTVHDHWRERYSPLRIDADRNKIKGGITTTKSAKFEIRGEKRRDVGETTYTTKSPGTESQAPPTGLSRMLRNKSAHVLTCVRTSA